MPCDARHVFVLHGDAAADGRTSYSESDPDPTETKQWGPDVAPGLASSAPTSRVFSRGAWGLDSELPRARQASARHIIVAIIVVIIITTTIIIIIVIVIIITIIIIIVIIIVIILIGRGRD